MKKTNRQANKLLKKYLSGETTALEEKILRSLAESNSDIKRILEIHSTLSTSIDLPSETEFTKSRKAIINSLPGRSQIKQSKWDFDIFTYLFPRPLISFSLASVFLLTGFLLSYFFIKKDTMLREIQLSAAKTVDLQSSSDEPYIYSNAHFRETSDGKISVSFDVTRHLDIISGKEDPLIEDILAQSIVSSNSLAERLKYISNSTTVMNPKIKQALISTLLNDTHEVVRQKSMNSLLKYSNDADIQKAFMNVLENETSVYMRISAIEYLSNYDNKPAFNPGLILNQNQKNRSLEKQIKKLNY